MDEGRYAGVVEEPGSHAHARRTLRKGRLPGYALLAVAAPSTLWWLLTSVLVALLGAHDLLTIIRARRRGRHRWERGLVVKAALPAAVSRVLILVLALTGAAATEWWGVLGAFPLMWALVEGFLQRYAPERAAGTTLPDMLALAATTFIHRDPGAADSVHSSRRAPLVKVLALGCVGVLLTIPPAESRVEEVRAPLRAAAAVVAEWARPSTDAVRRRPDRSTRAPRATGLHGGQPASPAVPKTRLETLCGTTRLSADALSRVVASAAEAVWHRLGGEQLGCPTGRVDVLGEAAVIWFQGPHGVAAVVSAGQGRAFEVLPPFAPLLTAAIRESSLAAVDARQSFPGGEHQLLWSSAGTCRLAWRHYGGLPIRLPASVTVLVLRHAARTQAVVVDIEVRGSTMDTFLLTFVGPQRPSDVLLVRYTEAEHIADASRTDGAATATDSTSCSPRESEFYREVASALNAERR